MSEPELAPNAPSREAGEMLSPGSGASRTAPEPPEQAVTFHCTFCGRRMGVPANRLGKQVRCPHCKQAILAPLGGWSPVVRPAESPEQAVTFHCTFCGRRTGAPAELLGKQVRCPRCRQVILAPLRAGMLEPPPFLTPRTEAADRALGKPDEPDEPPAADRVAQTDTPNAADERTERSSPLTPEAPAPQPPVAPTDTAPTDTAPTDTTPTDTTPTAEPAEALAPPPAPSPEGADGPSDERTEPDAPADTPTAPDAPADTPPAPTPPAPVPRGLILRSLTLTEAPVLPTPALTATSVAPRPAPAPAPEASRAPARPNNPYLEYLDVLGYSVRVPATGARPAPTGPTTAPPDPRPPTTSSQQRQTEARRTAPAVEWPAPPAPALSAVLCVLTGDSNSAPVAPDHSGTKPASAKPVPTGRTGRLRLVLVALVVLGSVLAGLALAVLTRGTR